jgi:uncharacterized OsmC-like protein
MTLKITIGLSDEQHFTLNDGRTLESLNPKELMLYAVAECAGLTILDILKEHSIRNVVAPMPGQTYQFE